MIIESLAIRTFGRVCGSQMVMENRSRDLKILWSEEDNLVGSVEQTVLCPIHSISCRVHGPSGEWFRTYITLDLWGLIQVKWTSLDQWCSKASGIDCEPLRNSIY